MPNYTPEQQATRLRNAATKLGDIQPVVDGLISEYIKDESIHTLASTTAYYLGRLCDLLDRKAVEVLG